MILIDSRYRTEPITYILDGRSGRTRPTVIRSNAAVGTTSSTVTHWADGMRLDIVASYALDAPRKWWMVMDQNPDILDPMSLYSGEEVRVP